LGGAGVSQTHPLQPSEQGGHYAAWEQPKLFSEDVRAGFRSLWEREAWVGPKVVMLEKRQTLMDAETDSCIQLARGFLVRLKKSYRPSPTR
jgi:hypothetical protein